MRLTPLNFSRIKASVCTDLSFEKFPSLQVWFKDGEAASRELVGAEQEAWAGSRDQGGGSERLS